MVFLTPLKNQRDRTLNEYMITILDNFFHFIIKLLSSNKSLNNFNNVKHH